MPLLTDVSFASLMEFYVDIHVNSLSLITYVMCHLIDTVNSDWQLNALIMSLTIISIALQHWLNSIGEYQNGPRTIVSYYSLIIAYHLSLLIAFISIKHQNYEFRILYKCI